MVPQSDRFGDCRREKQLTRFPAPPSNFAKVVQSGLSTMFQSDGKGDVKSYVVLALRSSNDVSVVTSNEIKKTVQPLMREWGYSHLRIAHEYSSGFVENSDEDENAALTQFTTLNDSETFPCFTEQETGDALNENTLHTTGTFPPQTKWAGIASPPGVSFEAKEWTVARPFQIRDEQRVVKSLMCCFYYLQQQTLKRIAKLWIKGICPRKQAKYPYRNKRGEGGGKAAEIPGWWPPEEECVFKEPDHVDKTQRMNLCLHLLRLRPTVQQLQEWNGDIEKAKQPGKTHEEGKWVAFLKSLADVTIVEEVNPTDPEKVKRRQDVMIRMYQIAELEEEYCNDEIDGAGMVQPLPLELQRTIDRTAGLKRSRQSSVVSSAADNERSETDMDAVEPVSKRARRVAGSKVIAKATLVQQKPSRTIDTSPKHEAKMETLAENTPYVCDSGFWDNKAQPQHGLCAEKAFRFRAGPATCTPLHTSFSSTMSDVSGDTYHFTPASDEYDLSCTEQGSTFLPYGPSHGDLQIHRVDVPQRQWNTVPNTPVISPLEMMRLNRLQPDPGNSMAALPTDLPTPGAPPGYPGVPRFQQGIETDHCDALQQPMHGLPSDTTIDHYKHCQELHSCAPEYEIHQGAPSAGSQNAGFAMGYDGSAPDQGWITSFHHDHPIHVDDNVPYHNMAHGPSQKLPPSALPASVERGFTGHASGVGDSACPPGYVHYYPHTM